MKPCTGCKHLHIRHERGWCLEPFNDDVNVYDSTTGRLRRETSMKYKLMYFENTTERCRRTGMPCGPERALYSPTRWQRFVTWLFDRRVK